MQVQMGSRHMEMGGKYMTELREWLLEPGTAMEEGIIGQENKGAGSQGTNLDHPDLLSLVNSQRVMHFFNQFLGGPSLTYDNKWLRAVAHGDSTPSFAQETRLFSECLRCMVH